MENTYLFKTRTTMKDYNRKNYWIDGDYIREEFYIKAQNVNNALQQYVEKVNNEYYDIISKNAIKNKQAMYIDTIDGDTKQVGYVLTGCVDIEKNDYKYTKQFVDLWITIERIENAF